VVSILYVDVGIATCLLSYLAYSWTLKIEATCSSETSVEFQQTTRRYIPFQRTDRKQDLKLYVVHNKICIVWGVVQLGPLGTAATKRSIVPGPDDYDDGGIGGGNRSTRRKPAPVLLCPPQAKHALPRREPGPPRWEASD
jgi:hypothetical protein